MSDRVDLIRAFEPRARALGEFYGGPMARHGWKVYRWRNYRSSEPLNGELLSPTHLRYWRSGGKGNACIDFEGLEPYNVTDLVNHPPVILSSELQKSIEIEHDGREAVNPEEQTFRFLFREGLASEEASENEITTALETTFKLGGEAAQFSNETKISIATRNAWRRGKTTTAESEEDLTRTLMVHPGQHIERWMERHVQHQRRTMTGIGQYRHTARIGKWKRSKGQKHWVWSGHAFWSDYEDLLQVVHGTAPAPWDGAELMRAHPVEAWLLAMLEAEVRAPFSFTKDFDGVSKYLTRQRNLLAA